MAIDSDPSIFNDRGSIGSSEELDEYGVWVKVEPQDFTYSGSGRSETAASSLPDIEDLPDLNLEDANLDAGFPSISAEAPVQEADGASDIHEEELPSFDNLIDMGSTEQTDFSANDEVSIDDFLDSSDSSEEVGGAEPAESSSPGGSFDDVSMDAFLENGEFSENPDLPPEPVAVAASTEEESDLDIDLHFDESHTANTDTTDGLEDFDFDVIDETPVAELADTANSEDLEIETVSDFDEFLNELADSETPSEPSLASSDDLQTPSVQMDAEDIHINVQESFDVETNPGQISETDGGSEFSMDVSLDSDADIAPEFAASSTSASENDSDLSVDLDNLELQDESFDDVRAVREDLTEIDNRVDEASSQVHTVIGQASAIPMDSGASTQLLMKIADELSSIKGELASLKNELSILRQSASETPSSEEDDAEAQKGGFFDEEEDEKIALTGDELDNILNTADFTEEAGSDAGEEMSMEAMAMDGFDMDASSSDSAALLSDQPDILGDFEDTSTEKPLISAESATETVIELDGESVAGAPPELQQLIEEGIMPMTPPPEDTSYLEAEEVKPDEIDLSSAVIDEPDLGELSLDEETIEEPSLESFEIELEGESMEPSPVLDEVETTIELSTDESLAVEEIAIPTDLTEDELEAPSTAESSFADIMTDGFTSETSSSDSEALEPLEDLDLPEEEKAEEELGELYTEEDTKAQTPAIPLNDSLRQEVRTVLSYMDQLLESLPEDKIEEFAKSDYFETYKKLFEELGLS